MLRTMFGDFRSYIPVDDLYLLGVPYNGGESAADAERRRAREAYQRLENFCKRANAPTPEVLEGIADLVAAGSRQKLLLALTCYALPDDLFAKIAEKTIAFDNFDTEVELVNRIYGRLNGLQRAVECCEYALRTGGTARSFWWYDIDLVFTNVSQEELDERKQNLAELTVTIPDILAKSDYFWTWAAVAKMTTSAETLVTLAKRCAKIRGNLGRRKQLAEEIIKSRVLSERAVLELLQTPRYDDEDTNTVWRIWIPAIETGKLNAEVVECVHRLVKNERASEYYQTYCDRWLFVPDAFRSYSEALEYMENFVERWAKRHL